MRYNSQCMVRWVTVVGDTTTRGRGRCWGMMSIGMLEDTGQQLNKECRCNRCHAGASDCALLVQSQVLLRLSLGC